MEHRNNRNGGGQSGRVDDRERLKNIKCFNCSRFGHVARNCRVKTYQDSSANIAKEKNGGSEDKGEGIALISSFSQGIDEWFIDSAATSHMSNNKSIFKNYLEYKMPTNIFLGDDTVVLAIGEGKVDLKSCKNSNIDIKLEKVMYVPRLSKNLLSVPAMALIGAEIMFNKGNCIVKKNGKEYIIGDLLDNKLYKMNTIPEYANASTASTITSREIWHCRFGHLNYNYIKEMENKQMVNGMDFDVVNKSTDKHCEAWILGKMQKKPMPKQSSNRATKPFEIIHTNVCGPMQVMSKGGSKYLLTFIDDYSRFVITYYIKSE